MRFLSLTAFAPLTLLWTAMPASAETLRFATGPFLATPDATRASFDRLFALVAKRAGVQHETVVMATWPAVNEALAAGQVDVAWMGGALRYATTRLVGGGPAIATVVVDGQPTYRAIVVARPGLSVTNWPQDGKGHSISFTHVNSTTGWLVPFAWLAGQGIDPRTWFRYSEGAQHPDNELLASAGKTDFATDSDTNRRSMIERQTLKPEANTVVWTSDPVPQDPIAVRAGLPETLIPKLQAAFTSISEADAKAVMMPRYTGFVPATDQDYAAILDATRRVYAKP